VYNRYADDFIILTNSNLKIANQIKEKIKKFLKFKLDLELSSVGPKTKVTCLRSNFAKYLGFVLYTYHNSKLTKQFSPYHNLSRTGGYNIKVGIDMEKVLNRLTDLKLCDKNHKPIAKNPFSILSIAQIIDKYNSMIRGSANFYIPAIDTFRSFTQIQYILEYSCYSTIAKKFKSSIFKLFNKYGKPPVFTVETTIKYKDKNKEPENKPDLPILKLSILSYLKNKENALKLKDKYKLLPLSIIGKDIFHPMKTINWRTYKNLKAYCIICGSTENIQWHHVTQIRKGKVSGFTQVMKQLNRKQVPVCPIHHHQVEQGLYNDIKLSDLVQVEYWIS
jgi:hypothetical protein